jgi:hypothetical protein
MQWFRRSWLRWVKGLTVFPTKNEIEKRMPAQLKHFGNTDTAHALWKGYLAGLADVGVLSPNDYHELNAALKDVAEDERRAIFLGYSGEYEEPMDREQT